MLAVRMCPDAHVLMVVVCVVCMNPAGRAIDADQGAHICCVCAGSAGNGPNLADCLEIRTCLLLRPGHAALCGMWPIARGLWPIANRTWPLRPSHAARYRLRPIARGLWPIANRTWPNSDQALPVACAIHPLGIARCCVQLVHIQAGGGCSILVVIKPNTIAENFTTQRHSRR